MIKLLASSLCLARFFPSLARSQKLHHRIKIVTIRILKGKIEIDINKVDKEKIEKGEKIILSEVK